LSGDQQNGGFEECAIATGRIQDRQIRKVWPRIFKSLLIDQPDQMLRRIDLTTAASCRDWDAAQVLTSDDRRRLSVLSPRHGLPDRSGVLQKFG